MNSQQGKKKNQNSYIACDKVTTEVPIYIFNYIEKAPGISTTVTTKTPNVNREW